MILHELVMVGSKVLWFENENKLKIRSGSKSISLLRCRFNLRKNCKKVFTMYEAIHSMLKSSSPVIMNVDEIRYSTTIQHSKMKFVTCSKTKWCRNITNGPTHAIAAVVFIASTGDVLLTVHIRKDKATIIEKKKLEKEKKKLEVTIR